MLGSPAYMSPEQMGGGGVDARSDMWALGVIIYECITGRLPFPGRSVAELIVNMSVGRFDPPTTVRPMLPRELDAWFARALGKRKEQRFPRVEDMALSFHAAILGRPLRRIPRVVRRITGLVGLAAAVLALQPGPSEATQETPIDPSIAAPPIATSPQNQGVRALDPTSAAAAPPSPRTTATTAPPAASLTAAIGSTTPSGSKRGHGPSSATTATTTPIAAPQATAPTPAPKHTGLVEVF
jgi:serine/threonine-protein kinase